MWSVFFFFDGGIMNVHKRSTESGQGLVLVALLFIAFAAILALVLDGGNAYAARRQAQNAADAGALAGATYMCEYNSASGGETKAVEFAVKNGAVNPPQVLANLSTGSVVVTATVQEDTFFAGLIGINEVSPVAVAEAECRPPVGMGVMPVGWSCRERVDEYEILPGLGCAQEFGPGNVYILMDSVKVKSKDVSKKCDPEETNPADPDYCYTQNDIVCDPLRDENGDGDVADVVDRTTIDTGTIDCDLDDDGLDELMAGGARSWLDLDGGGGGASELSNWIKNGFPNPIPPHTWLPEQSGVATSIFKDASFMVGKDVVLPVFNKLCPNYPNSFSEPETLAACNYGTLDDRSKAGSSMNFHIITFAQFHVSCVQTAKNRVWSEPALGLKKNDPCPGHQKAVDNESIDDNDKTIEGYFTTDQIYGYGGSGNFVDAGTFVVVLVR
jgi:hypothetical protein